MSGVHRLQVILAADAVGYSRLMSADDIGTLATLEAARAVFRSAAATWHGRIVDTAGDSILAVFETASGAVEAAREIQSRLREQDETRGQDRRLPFRIGIHLGDVIVQPDGTVYGDGVNIAARLQALAAPGAIYVSDAVRAAVRPEIATVLRDAGEHYVKNIAHPVRAFRIGKQGEPAAAAREEPVVDVGTAVPGFGGKPAIAVLPFDNMSTDPEQAHFADGMAEDILTRLAMWRWIPVIARNSSFAYRGRNVDLKRAGAELGARYILEGSVRRSGDRVRVTGQLIDAGTGGHVWAGRYDKVLLDVFDLQDELVLDIVAALEPAIGAAERSRVQEGARPGLGAWELFHKAAALYYELTRESLDACVPLATQAAAADSSFASPLSTAAAARLLSAMLGWADPEQAFKEAYDFSSESLRRDPVEPLALAVSAFIAAQMRQYAVALAAARKAVECNPSSALAHYCLGWNQLHQDQFAEAIAEVQTALRLSPHDPLRPLMLGTLSSSHLLLGDFETAHSLAATGVHEAPQYPLLRRSLANACGMLDRIDEGRAQLEAFLRLSPAYSTATARKTTPMRSPEVFERYMEGLRRLGWHG